MKTMLRLALTMLLCFIVCQCIATAAFADGDCFTIPKETTVIGEEAFSNCTGMTSVVIPATVKSFGRGAFSGCTNLKRIYFDGTQTQWYNISIAADNDPLRISRCVFLAEKPAITSIRVNGNDYTASFLGRMDMSSWSDKAICRDFWRLEDAYEDFKDCSLTGGYLPESNYPMSIEAGQVYVIDYTLKSGGTERNLMRCDGDIFELTGELNSCGFITDAPIRTETMRINGKDYTATYYGQRDISTWTGSWYEKYSYQDFWRIENAYEDFKDYNRVGGNYPGIMYPMSIEAGQVYVIDYTLKSGGTERKLMRCDGYILEPVGELNTYEITSYFPPIRTDTLTIGERGYTASYYGQVDISSWHEKYSCRDFWRLEDAYEDFKDCSSAGEYLPESNYPMPIEAGQVYVIDYTLKSGGVERKLMRCDGDIFEPEGRLNTHAFIAN